jgi:hypothetical protein
MNALRTFIGEHGREIAPMLAWVSDEPKRLALIRAYRGVLDGAAGAHDLWGRLLLELDL